MPVDVFVSAYTFPKAFLSRSIGQPWQVWAGWGGVRLRDDSLDLVYPTPPPGSTQLVLKKLAYQQWLLDVTIEVTSVRVVAVAGADTAGGLIVNCNDKVTHVQPTGGLVDCTHPTLLRIMVKP
eukprot:m.1376787 g.1376787  ORF g.1376787 m.1376787 type:complete len:123 (+) comp24963_c1_seq5:115-483(+)